MKYIVPSVLVFLMAAVSGQAGTIHGKVTGAKGESVVYIDAIPGKTFPAPAQHVEMDQKGLMFMPHLLVVEKGTTVDFKNDDSVEHNVFWQAISGNKSLCHNHGRHGRAASSAASSLTTPAWCRCSATYTRTWRPTSWSRQRRTSPKRTRLAPLRSRTFPMAATS